MSMRRHINTVTSGLLLEGKNQARFDPRILNLPEFRAWFGDSKTVDGNGRPYIFYHGTSAAFSEFDPAKVGSRHADWEIGEAYYFSAFPSSASAYADSVWSSQDGKTPAVGANVVPVFLRVLNPKYEDYQGAPADYIGDDITQAKAAGHDGLLITDVDDGVLDTQYVVFSKDQIRSIYDWNLPPKRARR